MPRTQGLKKAHADWRHPLYPVSKKRAAAPVTFTPEQLAQRQAARDAETERFLAHLAGTGPAPMSCRGEEAVNKLKDREAQVAVEGSTDAEHDNLEGPGL